MRSVQWIRQSPVLVVPVTDGGMNHTGHFLGGAEYRIAKKARMTNHGCGNHCSGEQADTGRT